MASALTCESGWSCMTAQHTRHDRRAVAMEPWLPRNRWSSCHTKHSMRVETNKS